MEQILSYERFVFDKFVSKGIIPKCQHTIKNHKQYRIADFAFTDVSVLVELDGPSHLYSNDMDGNDNGRDDFYKERGWIMVKIVYRYFNPLLAEKAIENICKGIRLLRKYPGEINFAYNKKITYCYRADNKKIECKGSKKIIEYPIFCEKCGNGMWGHDENGKVEYNEIKKIFTEQLSNIHKKIN